jgi:hypothetical protein
MADQIVSKKGMGSARASHVQIVEGGGQSENQFLLRILLTLLDDPGQDER